MPHTDQLRTANKSAQQRPKWRKCALVASAAFGLVPTSAIADAQTNFSSVGIPEAHYWEELPGYRSAKPQASVTELLGPKPLAVSIEQLQQMEYRDQSDTYRLLTDEQRARQDAERETAASRIGASNWHYGLGLGIDDVKFRLSYEF